MRPFAAALIVDRGSFAVVFVGGFTCRIRQISGGVDEDNDDDDDCFVQIKRNRGKRRLALNSGVAYLRKRSCRLGQRLLRERERERERERGHSVMFRYNF